MAVQGGPCPTMFTLRNGFITIIFILLCVLVLTGKLISKGSVVKV